MNIWLVDHPTSQYKQDVKALAKARKLMIIDSKFRGQIDPEKLAPKPPRLTKKGAKKAPKTEDEEG